MVIREAGQTDSLRILEIYTQGLATRNATFETQAPDWDTWDSKHHDFCRLVYETDGRVLGWAALSPVSSRACYKGVAELSIYVDTSHGGKGIGTALMEALIAGSEANGIWTLYSSIFPENVASHHLHIRHGFREIGIRERIAQLDGRWRNTLILERRSTSVGV